ncbi:TetR family transcriptional regulator [Kitasatospora sp. NPDC057015]|uniref:TetR family transcriptional regulator n=1 Tax=Kitasatospora sp. NPDC057015 TaxID=3346001 RepID=UPI0036311074
MQQRSQERYERLVDACASLLDEVGATALTTKAVAQRARVPIGTLYQFFSGKESLLAALAARNLDRYLDRLARRLEAGDPPGVAGFVNLAVEEFVAMKRAVPGFGQVDFGLVDRTPPGIRDSEHLLDTALDNNATVALRLQALGGDLFTGRQGLGAQNPGARGLAAQGPAPQDRAAQGRAAQGPEEAQVPGAGGPEARSSVRPGFTLALRVALEAADAVLKLAFRTDPDGDPVLIAECKRLLRRYLTEVPPSPADPDPRPEPAAP